MYRNIKQVSQAKPTSDGDGVSLKRNDFFAGELDPFLMLDEFKASPEERPNGFPTHPHRGIQTLSYMIHGKMSHKDSLGNESEVAANQLQWMHTGKGILHSEKPDVDENGVWGFQFWLNVPREEKYQQASYQDFAASAEINEKGMFARILAGNWQINQQNYTADFQKLASEGSLLDVELQENSQVQITDTASSFAIYIIQGNLQVNQKDSFSAGSLIKLESEGDLVEISAHHNGARALVFKGQPIGEKIVHYGPFVMNSEAEIKETLQAYRENRLV